MSLPGAGGLCYLEMHPAPNRNNRDGSRFKALAQNVKPLLNAFRAKQRSHNYYEKC